MSMYRSRRNHWKSRWPWKRLFPPLVSERFCPKCQMPFQDGPMPKPYYEFREGSVSVLVYPAGAWKRDELVLRVGRWRVGGRQFYCSEYIPINEISDVMSVIRKAVKELPSSIASAKRKQVRK